MASLPIPEGDSTFAQAKCLSKTCHAFGQDNVLR